MNKTITLEEFCKIHNVSSDELVSKSRKANLVDLRRVYAYILDKAGLFNTEIAPIIGRNRSTVIHHVSQAKELIRVGDVRTKRLVNKTIYRV